MTPIRPNFERPPLQEQAISIVFQPLDRFRIVDYGLFWAEIADAFPNVATDVPLEAPVEQFDNFRLAEMSFQFLTVPPLPRAMFSNPENGELVQLQNNRFGFNWAKVGALQYPRSEPLMARFQELFAQFIAYARRNGLGELVLKQCELTNLNLIPVSDFGTSYSDVANAVCVDAVDLGIPNLQSEIFERSRQHKILGDDGKPIGRLHTVLAPVVSNVDNSEGIRYELTARSAANIRSLEDAEKFFAIARNTINGAFLASITADMKKRWGEYNGD